MKLKAEYTHGNIAVIMLKTAAAMLASTLAMSGYNLADTYFVGQLNNVEALAAMGFSFPVVMLAGCIFGGFGGGCMTLMAHSIGAGDTDGARQTVSAGMLLISIISTTIAILGICFAEPMYHLLGAQGEALVHLTGYMNIWFFGCITAGVSMPGNHLLIAAGKPMISSVMTILGMCANVVLDPLMIFGGEGCRQMVSRLGWGWLSRLSNPLWDLLGFVPGMGIRGAALATIISQAMSALLLLGLLHRLKLFSFRPIPRGELLRIWRKITGYAIPAILGMMLFPITNYITTRVTASFGDAMVAATAAAGRLEMVTFVVPMAFGIPLMSVVAQNYGAKLYSRVKYVFKFASAIAFGILAVAAVVLFFFTHRIAPLFTPAIQVQELIVTYMKIIPWGFGLLELSRYAGFALTGTGHPRLDATLKALRMVALLIPLSLLAWWLKWQNGVFYARLAADVIGGVICWGWAAWIVHRLPADGEEVPHQKTIPPPQKA